MTTQAARELFARRFGRDPDVIASAPGRVNLIGEHTDYNGGEVLPIAIQRRTWVAVGESTGVKTLAVSRTEAEEGQFDLDDPQRSGKWWDYAAGTVRALGPIMRLPRGLELAVWSDVPSGAGLSSSAALEVAVGRAIATLSGSPVSALDLAVAAHRAENEFVGVSCGIMDQFATALSRPDTALHIWCDVARVEHVPFAHAVLVFDTAVPRSLRHSAFNTRREECERALAILQPRWERADHLAHLPPEAAEDPALPDPLRRRVRHVTTETRRVQATVGLLRAGDFDTGRLGRLLLASHASLRDDYECSTPELDWFVERAVEEPGVFGARLTGAGWGGCAIAVGAVPALEAAAPRIAADYGERFKREPRVIITRAEEGERVEEDSVRVGSGGQTRT